MLFTTPKKFTRTINHEGLQAVSETIAIGREGLVRLISVPAELKDVRRGPEPLAMPDAYAPVWNEAVSRAVARVKDAAASDWSLPDSFTVSSKAHLVMQPVLSVVDALAWVIQSAPDAWATLPQETQDRATEIGLSPRDAQGNLMIDPEGLVGQQIIAWGRADPEGALRSLLRGSHSSMLSYLVTASALPSCVTFLNRRNLSPNGSGKSALPADGQHFLSGRSCGPATNLWAQALTS